jgi:pantoate--beta-alanine ligase
LVQKRVRDAATIAQRMRELLTANELGIDYAALVDPQTLETVAEVTRPTLAVIAARVGNTRLIDNELIG